MASNAPARPGPATSTDASPGVLRAPLVDRAGPAVRLRERVLLPADREVTPDRRGFHAWAEGPSLTEPVGRAFLAGYRAGLRARHTREAAAAIQQMSPQWRGFAMEGLGMAAGVRDGLGVASRRRFTDLLVHCGERHGYMAYVGLGWSVARLPRLVWPRFDRLDPVLAPLVLDGYGFHETFFHTEQVLARRQVPFPLERHWPGSRDDGAQQLMQGVGRALWFVAGGAPTTLAGLVERFDTAHHASLWAGTGLAAAYAGGRDAAALRTLRGLAAEHRDWLAQGAAFGIEARVRAGLVVAHTEVAASELCGRSAAEAAAVTWVSRPDPAAVDAGDWGVYEVWRHDVAARLR